MFRSPMMTTYNNKMNMNVLIPVISASLLTLGVVITMGVINVMECVQGSVGIAPPTETMIEEEKLTTVGDNNNPCPLFRYFPNLIHKIAWRSLGVTKPSPIHTCIIRNQGSDENDAGTATNDNSMEYTFLVKREDLISPLYGGNKVRGLQHLLAICEAKRENGNAAYKQLVPMGSGGSNQIVATVVHSRKLGWDGTNGNQINPCWVGKDEPDFDNTLNMLSVFSFPNIGWTRTWDAPKSPVTLMKAIRGVIQQTDFIPLMPGGNCPSGVIGQMSAVLELAEQIRNGECGMRSSSSSPNNENEILFNRIYVPIGSGCTISGIIIGIVLVRYLNLQNANTFLNPNLKVVGCNVHHGIAKLDKLFNFHIHPLFGFMPLTIYHTVSSVCDILHKQLGGPDLKKEALEFVKNNVILKSDADIVGVYGAHSEKTRTMSKLYDTNGILLDKDGNTTTNQPPLWICGHFVAKALTPLVNDLEEEIKTNNRSTKTFPKYLLWMTKSAVQPRGSNNEWNALLRQSDIVKEWADKGKAESILRPGNISTTNDTFFEGEKALETNYRSVMTKIL